MKLQTQFIGALVIPGDARNKRDDGVPRDPLGSKTVSRGLHVPIAITKESTLGP